MDQARPTLEDSVRSSADTSSFKQVGTKGNFWRRFVNASFFETYQSVARISDYRSLRCAVKNDRIAIWKQHFVIEGSMLDLELSCVTSTSVQKASACRNLPIFIVKFYFCPKFNWCLFYPSCPCWLIYESWNSKFNLLTTIFSTGLAMLGNTACDSQCFASRIGKELCQTSYPPWRIPAIDLLLLITTPSFLLASTASCNSAAPAYLFW